MKFSKLVMALAAIVPGLALADPQYTITDLGAMPPGTYTQTFGISSSGNYAIGRGLGADGTNYPWPAFVWSAGTGMVEQGNLAGRNYAWGYGVNNNGVGVGVSALSGVGADPLPVMWTNGTATQLALPNGQVVGRAFDINDNGIAVGSVGSGTGEIASIYNTKTGTSSLILAVSDQNSYMQTAMAINNAGLVVGTGVDMNSRNVILTYDTVTGKMTEIAPLPYSGFNSSVAYAISENGYVAGSSGNGSQPFIWSATGGMVSVPLPSISGNGSVRSVNDMGWAVGNSGGSKSNPFLFADGTTYLINDVIVNGAGWDFTTTTSASAMGISNNGSIFGTAQINGIEHAYMLTPVPEPASYALMVAGLIAVGSIARRRQAAQG